MEKFLLKLVNSFRVSPDRIERHFDTCTECRCGIFQFDDFRVLPENLVNTLGLKEIEDFDDERQRYIWAYSPQFNA